MNTKSSILFGARVYFYNFQTFFNLSWVYNGIIGHWFSNKIHSHIAWDSLGAWGVHHYLTLSDSGDSGGEERAKIVWRHSCIAPNSYTTFFPITVFYSFRSFFFVFVNIRNVLLTLLVIFLLFPLGTTLIPLWHRQKYKLVFFCSRSGVTCVYTQDICNARITGLHNAHSWIWNQSYI